MKRLFSWSLALALILCLCACGDKGPSTPAFTVPTPAAEVTPTPAPATPEPTEAPTASAPVVDTVAYYEKFLEVVVNEWYFCQLYLTDLDCTLEIFPDLTCTMTISNYFTGEIVCQYSGNMVEEWAMRTPGSDVPDFVSFDFYDEDDNYVYGGYFSVEYLLLEDYYCLTLYDHAYGETPFDLLESAIIPFLTPTNDKITESPRRSGTFPVAFWDYDQESGKLHIQHVYEDDIGHYRSETHQVVPYDLTSAAYDELDHLYLEMDVLLEITTDRTGTVTGVRYLPDQGGSDDEMPFYDYLDAREWDTWGSDWPVFPPSPRFALFDFDGDGDLEMLFEAYDHTGNMSMGFSQFCTLNAWGEVEALLSCELSGGTVGGEALSFYYDNASDGFLVGLSGFAGGFGGYAEWWQMYNYENNKLTLLTEFELYSPDNKAIEYSIDQKPATQTQYDSIVARFNSVVMYQ